MEIQGLTEESCAKQNVRLFINKSILIFLTMKDFNFYTGIYKAIAVAVCMMLFMFLNKAAHACEKNKAMIKTELTHKYNKR